MNRWIRTGAIVLFALMVFSGVALAQDGGEATIDWGKALAMFLNGTFVFVAVELIKNYGSQLPVIAKQIIALAAGPVLMMFAVPALESALGATIDWTAIQQALAGLTSSTVAMTSFKLAKLRGGK